MEESNIRILKDYQYFYETKVREWETTIIDFSDKMINLQKLFSESEEKYGMELLNAQNTFKALFRLVCEAFDNEKVAIFALLSESTKNLEDDIKEDLRKLAANLENDSIILHKLIAKELEICKRKYEHNLKKQKMSYKVLLEEAKKNFEKKSEKKPLSIRKVLSCNIDGVAHFEDLSAVKVHRTLEMYQSRQDLFINVNDKLFNQLSSGKYFHYQKNLLDLMKKYLLNGSFQDFNLYELLVLYQEILHTLGNFLTVDSSEQNSSENCGHHNTSCSTYIRSELDRLRMRIIQLETSLVKTCIQQLKNGDSINLRLLKEH